jgi:Amt family ammonium transporter
LEAGFCRSNNSINVLAKNLIVFCVAAIAFLMFGFGLMYGDSSSHLPCRGDFEQNDSWSYYGHFSPTTEYNKFSQKSQFILPPKKDNPLGFPSQGFSCLRRKSSTHSIASVFFFQLAFAGTAATIVSGAVAERMKFWAFFCFSFILVGFLYPIVGHWVWSEYGWLKILNFQDFAGSTVVHTVGGTAALVGAWLLKPRWNRFNYDPQGDLDLDDNIKKKDIPERFKKQDYFTDPSNLTSATLGCLILWLGWLGFNGGSTYDLKQVSHVIITTIMSAATAGIAALLSSEVFSGLSKTFEENPETGKPQLSTLINGILGGLVGVTASSAYINVNIAVLIGAVSGVIVVGGSLFLRTLKIDDPVGAIPVHLFCGCWGTLAVFLSLRDTEVYANDYNMVKQLGVQLLGFSSVFLFILFLSWIAWVCIGWFLNYFDRIIPNKEMSSISTEGNLLEQINRVARQGIRVTLEEEEDASDGFWDNHKDLRDNPKNTFLG